MANIDNGNEQSTPPFSPTVATPIVNTQFYGTLQVAIASVIPQGTTLVITEGYSTPGDGGGASYVPSSAGIASGKFQSADGNWWLIAKCQEILPEMFGAIGNGVSDDASAFQNALNVIYLFGGGTLLLTKAQYYINQYTPLQVPLAIGQTVLANSGCLFVPPNCVISSNCKSEIIFEGGTSSPLGYSLSVNMLFFNPYAGLETSVAVSSINQIVGSIVVASTTGLAVNQKVQLARPGGITVAIPNTPSQERSPQQILTIASIVGTTVTFKESFIHWFAAAQNVTLYFIPGHDYAANMYLEDVTVSASLTSVSVPYVLFSRVRKSGLRGSVHFNKTSFSFAASQEMNIDNLFITEQGSTIEATSIVRIGAIVATGNASTNALGPLFFGDNCRDCRIGSYTAFNYIYTGLAMLYGIDCVIDELNLHGCGGSADPSTTYYGAATFGFPATGAHATLAIARSPTYLCRNVPPSTILIRRLNITGAPTVPLRLHDTNITVDEAYIDVGAGSTGIVRVGMSGLNLADATYFPLGGVSSAKFGRIFAKVAAGTPVPIFGCDGVGGPFAAYPSVLSIPALSTDTTITVVNSDGYQSGGVAYFLNEAGTSTIPVAKTIVSKVGNVLTINSATGFALSAGQGSWTSNAVKELTSNIFTDQFKVNDIEVGAFNGESQIFPNVDAGTGNYTFQTSPPGFGEWELDVFMIGPDKAHACGATYRVVYSNINATFPLNGIFQINKDTILVRTNSTISSFSIAAGVVSIVFNNTTKTFIYVRYSWRRVKQVAALEGTNF